MPVEQTISLGVVVAREKAYEHLNQYDRLLPGDAGVIFLKGVSLEGMGRHPEAANQYAAFLKRTQKGEAAEYAYSRLRSWGYVK